MSVGMLVKTESIDEINQKLWQSILLIDGDAGVEI